MHINYLGTKQNIPFHQLFISKVTILLIDLQTCTVLSKWYFPSAICNSLKLFVGTEKKFWNFPSNMREKYLCSRTMYNLNRATFLNGVASRKRRTFASTCKPSDWNMVGRPRAKNKIFLPPIYYLKKFKIREVSLVA